MLVIMLVARCAVGRLPRRIRWKPLEGIRDPDTDLRPEPHRLKDMKFDPRLWIYEVESRVEVFRRQRKEAWKFLAPCGVYWDWVARQLHKRVIFWRLDYLPLTMDEIRQERYMLDTLGEMLRQPFRLAKATFRFIESCTGVSVSSWVIILLSIWAWMADWVVRFEIHTFVDLILLFKYMVEYRDCKKRRASLEMLAQLSVFKNFDPLLSPEFVRERIFAAVRTLSVVNFSKYDVFREGQLVTANTAELALVTYLNLRRKSSPFRITLELV